MSERSRIPELDGLRGIAIGTVLAFHYIFLITPLRTGSLLSYLFTPGRIGWSGVDLFFVLSGFLIGGILLDARESANYYRVFYARRFLRIVPVYSCFLAIFLLLRSLAPATNKFGLALAIRTDLPIAPYFLFLQNFWMGARDTLGGNTLGITWSLAIEEQFYLVLPLLIRITPRRYIPRLILVAVCLAEAVRLACWFLLPSNRTLCFVLMPCRGDALLLGVLGAYAMRQSNWRQWLGTGHRLLYLLFVLGFGILMMIKILPFTGYLLMVAGGYTWIAAFFLCLLLFALLSQSFLSRVLRLNWLRALGMVAYGTYLFHELILNVLFAAVRGAAPNVVSWADFAWVLVSLALTIILCSLSWKYFERPLVRFGHRFQYRDSAPHPGDSLLSSIAVTPADP